MDKKDEKFIKKWKPIHEQGIVRYILKDALMCFLILIVVAIIAVVIFPVNKERFYYNISQVIFFYIICECAQALSCIKKDKRYVEITGNK
ncbi:MAG: hypothetical protein K0R54_4643 [Clostridiaceae bacterium]|nr:hypothetical protein [Clostridiaceae bacterium]